MTGIILLTTVGVDAGPFNLYSNTSIPEFSVPFGDLYITAEQLLAGYATDQIPDGTTVIRVKSINANCTNYIDINVPLPCYKFEPEGSYLLSFINKSNGGYYYGTFTGYSKDGVITDSPYLIKLHDDLTIDTSFDPGTSINYIASTGSSILEQSDDKIIITGEFTTYQGVGANRIIRLNPDGTRDDDFVIGSGFDDATVVPGIDSLDRIIIGGTFQYYNGNYAPRLARLLSDGTFDPTLSIGSGFNSTVTCALVNTDDSLILSGYFTNYNGTGVGGIIKLNEDGTIDSSFNAGTGFSTVGDYYSIWTRRILGEDSFYVAGRFTSYNGISANRIIKLNQNGTKDTSFDYGTGFDGDDMYALDIIWDNKILVNGDFTSYNGTTSYTSIILNADGSILYAFDFDYFTSDTIIMCLGNDIFVPREEDGCLEKVYTYVP